MSRTAKVLFVSPSAYTLGGLATWLDYLIPGLNSSGVQATLGLVEGPRYHLSKRYLDKHPVSNALSIYCGTGTRTGRVNSIRRVIRQLQPDLVLSVNIPDALIAAAAERSSGGIKSVMTCHGIQPDLFGDMQLLGDTLDAVVCTNKLACQLASSIGHAPTDRVYYASYGTKVSDKNVREMNATPTIGYVGRLEQDQKRIHDLPLLLKHLMGAGQACNLLIAGTGPEEASLKQELASLNFPGKIDFLGHVPAEELNARVYWHLDALMLTSIWETGPIVLWEAMANSVPVVTTRYTGCGLEGALMPDVNCLMFEPGEMPVAAQHLVNLFANPSLRSALINNAWEMVHQRYSHAASVVHWCDVIRNIHSVPSQDVVTTHLRSKPNGRLQHWFGPQFAERLRQLAGRSAPDSGPGGEWPHTLCGSEYSEQSFWNLAAQQDQQHPSNPLKSAI